MCVPKVSSVLLFIAPKVHTAARKSIGCRLVHEPSDEFPHELSEELSHELLNGLPHKLPNTFPHEPTLRALLCLHVHVQLLATPLASPATISQPLFFAHIL